MPKLVWKWPWEKPESETKEVRSPKVGGTRAPSSVEEIDFQKPHDFYFRFGYQNGEVCVFESCLLVGFTTPMNDGSSNPEWGERQHNRWIVLQRPDKRRIYVPPDGLLYIEDAAQVENPSEGNDGRSI